ncbi:acyltransferase family protein [Leptothermofonsia sp. ETS-13]|uniref:acyltransferase family protein n=1 Tax=Leptothermofonsia sp. ETS-13 TaxID=3035696 RepID=UPI003B9F3CE2
MANNRILRQRLGWLEGIRIFGVVFLLLYHAQSLFTGYAYTPQPIGLAENLEQLLAPVESLLDRGWLFRLLSIPIWFGFQFVDVFILISGFCLVLSQKGKPLDISGFLKRRVLRLLFPFWTIAWLSLPILWAIGVAANLPLPNPWQMFAAATFPLLADFSGELLRATSSTWGFMPLILSFGLLSPFLWLLLLRWGTANLLLVSTIITIGYRALAVFQFDGHPTYVLFDTPVGWYPFLLFPAKLSTFVIGMVVGHYYLKGRGPVFWQAEQALLIGLGVYGAGFVCQFYRLGWIFADLLLPIGLSLCCMVVSRAVVQGQVATVLNGLGGYSYSYFLLSSLVADLTIKVVVRDSPSLYAHWLPVIVLGTWAIAILADYTRPALQKVVTGILRDLDYVMNRQPMVRRRQWNPQIGDRVSYRGKTGWTVLKIEKLLDEQEFFLCQVSDGEQSLWVNEDDLEFAASASRRVDG